jgi:hypothetical protein
MGAIHRHLLVRQASLGVVSRTPAKAYPETSGTVVEWRREEQEFKGEEEEERHGQNQTLEGQ